MSEAKLELNELLQSARLLLIAKDLRHKFLYVVESKIPDVSSWVATILKRYSSVALLMEDFFGAIMNNKATKFPSGAVAEALQQVECVRN